VPELAADLRRLGVAAGDVLMVHASMRAVGKIDGGAESLVRALDESVGADGTVLMGLGAVDNWGWVNDRPELERPALLADAEDFDYLRTPSDPEMGVLAEVFRVLPGTLVNDHPEARFGARGRLARELLEGAPWNDYYGPDSPLERFVRAGGKVLRLGADLGTVTLIHYAEYLVPLASKRRVRRFRRLRGGEIRVVECLDDNHGIVEYAAGEDYFADVLAEYLALGRGARGRVGNARSELLDAADLVEFSVTWMARHLVPSPPGRGPG
jgi:aminoglycoside N3'-acetyltransferase